MRLYGLDHAVDLSASDFRNKLALLLGEVATGLSRAVGALDEFARNPDLRRQNDVLGALITRASERLAASKIRLATRDVDRPFRVVLMGRTMAGKSTLFEYLTRGDGSGVGEGGQRTTRDARVGTVLESDIEIVDTPGVGAMDGAEDHATAFRQVADADLVLWVATNEATQERTGRALEQLADSGKPILVALNCLRDARDELNLWDLLEEPDLVFGGDTLGNLAPIERHLSKAGGRYIAAIPVHAQGALLATAGELDEVRAKTLHRNSRIDELLQAIRDQHASTRDLRRLVSIGDFARGEILEAAGHVREALEVSRSALAAAQGSQHDFRKRAERRIADAHAELRAAFAGALSSRERWIERVDVELSDRQINAQWEEEGEALRAELKRHAADVGRRLETALKQIAIDAADDWAQIDVGGFQDLGGRASIWGNRLVKVGGRVAGALGTAALGAKIGGLAGTALGPGLGNAIGVGIGSILGLVVGLLGVNRGIDWVGDRLFRSTDQIRDRRRQRIRDQFSPLIVELNENLILAGNEVSRAWKAAVDHEVSRQALSAAGIQSVADALRRTLSEDIEPALAQADLELARGILQVMGRGRAAAAIRRATRWRGAGIAVEVPEPEFSELVLFPLRDDVETVLPTADVASRSTSALQILRSLTDRPITVHAWDDDEVRVSLERPLAPGVREAWESLAALHSGVKVRIGETTIEGDSA